METWKEAIGNEKEKPYFQHILQQVQQARDSGKTVYPPKNEVFSAFSLTEFKEVKVVILGQDPYHGPNQAHGLSFSVKPPVAPPPSLLNIYKELETDIPDFQIPQHGYLVHWANQGVLLLNTVLTVERGLAHSHAKFGWETFTDQVIAQLNALRAGSALLKWQADEKGDLVGNVQFASENQPKNKLNLPFKFDFNSLEIYQGKFNWEWLADFPINGSTTATITPKNIMQGEIFPIQTAFRMNLFSEDKHTLSLATTKGVIEESAFDLPLTLSGYVKYHGFRLFSQATIAANQREMRFSPKSMFHIISGKERFLTINELTIPLGDIYINRYGVNGRLQAHFKGETPDFKEINMRLDGRADNFKMGLLHVFDDANGKNSIKDRWQWTLNGETKIHAIQGNVAFSGKGNWHKNLIQFTQFNGKMNQVKLKGVTIPKTELALTEPVKFAYEQWHLTGGAELRSPELQFDYGGKLLEPRTQVRFAGELEKLRFDGDIQAGKAGPIKLTASRQLQEGASSSEFVGSLKWAEQPTSVFQALIPPRTNWVIKDGTIKGDTKFHTHATQGLVASGQISIKNGELSLPKGNISGIEFVLPYQLMGNQVKFGQDKPISVMIDEVNVGVAMRDIRVNIDGYYPYNANKPLNLRRLNLTLLDGTLSVEHFALPQLKPAYLELKNIVLERVMELVNYQQIELKGKANAKLPFWLDGSPCYICEGEITQSGHSNLKISKELMDAMAKTSGYSERILLYLLNDTKVTDLQGRVNVAQSGDMTLNAKLKLQLNQQEKTKVNFNYNHKENVFDLWHLINSASYIGQGIENGILQKLDSTK